MALSGMLHQNDNPNTNIFSNIVFGIFTRSFSYCRHWRWSIPNFLDINSVPTPNIAREFFNSRPAVINVSNSSRNIARLNFCRLFSGIIFSPIVFINKNTAVMMGGWRLRTITSNSVLIQYIRSPPTHVGDFSVEVLTPRIGNHSMRIYYGICIIKIQTLYQIFLKY